MRTNIVYDKETNEVVIAEMNDVWVLPSCFELATFDNGAEPILTEVDGRLYLKTNAMIANPEYFED